MKVNRAHTKYYFTVRHTTLEHQLQIFYHIYLFIQEGLHRVRFLIHEKSIVKLWVLIIEMFLDGLVC